jgi:hypothetical protein
MGTIALKEAMFPIPSGLSTLHHVYSCATAHYITLCTPWRHVWPGIEMVATRRPTKWYPDIVWIPAVPYFYSAPNTYIEFKGPDDAV